MMQTSVLRYPKSDRFIRIHASLMIACKNDACAAALIVFFESWHNYRNAQQEYTSLYNQMMKDLSRPPIIDTSGWQFHTNAQLEAGLLGMYKIDTINKALEFLEMQLKFISSDVPENLKFVYKTGRTKWFLLRANKINEWFSEFEAKTAVLLISPDKPKPQKKIDVKIQGDHADNAMRVFCYWRKYMPKRQNALSDLNRLRMIRTRLTEGFTVQRLCYAVEGNIADPFYQGENDRGTVFNNIENIFKTAGQVERMIGQAEAAGISLKQVEIRLAESDGSDRLKTPVSGKSEISGASKGYSIHIGKTIAPLIIAFDRDSMIAKINEIIRLNPDKIYDLKIVTETANNTIEAQVGIVNLQHTALMQDFIKQLGEINNV